METIQAYLYNAKPLCKVAATQKVETVSIPVFLPHELLHAIAKAGPEQAPALCKDGVFESSGFHVLDVKPQKLSIGEHKVFTPRDFFKPCQMAKSLLGDWGRSEITAFWKHLMGLEEWSSHPVLKDGNIDKSSHSLSCSILRLDLYQAHICFCVSHECCW